MFENGGKYIQGDVMIYVAICPDKYQTICQSNVSENLSEYMQVGIPVILPHKALA